METKPKRIPFPWLFRWKIWRMVLLLVAGLITADALFYAEENLRGKHAWESYKAQMEAKGEVLDFEKFVPPPVADDQNFAATPFFAQLFDFLPGTQTLRDSNTWARVNKVDLLFPENMREELDGKWQTAKQLDFVTVANELLNTNQHAKKPPQFKPEQKLEAEQTVMSKIEPATDTIEELRKASQRPYSRFNISYDYEPKYSIILPHLSHIHDFCEILELRSCIELRTGDTEAAFQDVNLLFHLVQSLSTEPLLISQAVRAKCLGEMLQSIWEGLEQRKWSDAQLNEFIKELRTMDFMRDGIRSLQAEECFSDTFFARLRRSRNPVQQISDIMGQGNDFSNPGLPGEILAALTPSGWFYFEQLNYHRMFHNQSVGAMTPNRIDPDVVNESKFQSVGRNAFVTVILHHEAMAQLLLPSLNTIVFKFTRAQTAANLALVACALERYRLKHGQFPENSAALAPEYLPAIPNDVIMDQPLKYRRESDGTFTLYSVGWNKKDDGGIAAKKDKDNQDGDWVWKYPTVTESR